MKQAQDLRQGNVILVDNEPMVILRSELSRSLRHASVCKMKMKNLLTGANMETVFRADDKFHQIILERKQLHYSYFADPLYVWMDADYHPYEVEAESMGDALNYLEDAMQAEAVFYDDKVISIELPNTIVREVTYTEPAVRGDTSSGKVTKAAQLASGHTVQVPLFVDTGDRIEIDTRTNEYRGRSNK